MAGFTLTVRRRGAVDRRRFDELEPALAALEDALDELARTERRGTAHLLTREYTAVEQVVARAEVEGPGGLRGGVDVRGDGSSEAFTGRWRRRLVAQRAGETAFEALRRVLTTR